MLSPLSLLFVSELLTGFFVLFSFGTVPMLRKLQHVEKRRLLPLLAVGLLNSALAPLLWFAGLANSTAVNASLFGNSDVLFLLLLAIIFLRESWSKAHLWAAACVTAGITIVALKGGTMGLELRLGDMFFLLSSFTYSIGSILFRRFLHTVEPQIVIFLRCLIAIAVFFLVSPFMPHSFVAEIWAFPLFLIPSLLGFAFISRFLNVFSFYVCIERLPVTTVSLFSSLGIVLGPLFAYLFLFETLHWYHFVGGACIVAGTIVLEMLGMHPTERHHKTHLEQRLHHRP